jgi:tRNA(Phe) wybutosine-synthesizing methylase Tyw3
VFQIHCRLLAAGKVIVKAAEYKLAVAICINDVRETFSKAARIETYMTRETRNACFI